MSRSILEVFDASLQKAQIWLNELASELGWEERPPKRMSRLAHGIARAEGSADD